MRDFNQKEISIGDRVVFLSRGRTWTDKAHLKRGRVEALRDVTELSAYAVIKEEGGRTAYVNHEDIVVLSS